MASKDRQRIQYLTASDGVRLAWADSGEGSLVVKASNWLTHLEYDWDSPVWRHWIRFFSDHFRFVRFDERGCGMSDWSAGDLSLDRWVTDLEAVVDAAKPAGPILFDLKDDPEENVNVAVKASQHVDRLSRYLG